jgi:hypothetical protein
MVEIKFPEPGFRIKKEGDRDWIFDSLRKKWVVLTPEEWVRQNFIAFMLLIKKYPPTLMAVEKEIRLGELKKRFDLLVYDKQMQPWLMVECKSQAVSLDEKVLEQAMRYNISVPVRFIVITNGDRTFAWEKKGRDLQAVHALPDHG